jgi:hypothetical protein
MSQPVQGAHPVLKAMLVCNQAIREAGTNKVTLVGLFDRISSPGFPMGYVGGLAVYARVAEAAGHYAIRLELVRLDDEQAIGRTETEITISGRMGTHELTFEIGRIDFERSGSYEFRLFANGRFVGSAPLYVVESDEERDDGEG